MPTAWLWMSIIDVMSTSLEIIQGMMEMAEENNPNLEREIEMGSGTLPYKPLSAASTIARKSGQSSLSLRCCPVEPWSPISTSPQQQQWIRSKNKVIISVRCMQCCEKMRFGLQWSKWHIILTWFQRNHWIIGKCNQLYFMLCDWQLPLIYAMVLISYITFYVQPAFSCNPRIWYFLLYFLVILATF